MHWNQLLVHNAGLQTSLMRSFPRMRTKDLFCSCDNVESAPRVSRAKCLWKSGHGIRRWFAMGHCFPSLSFKWQKKTDEEFLNKVFLFRQFELRMIKLGRESFLEVLCFRINPQLYWSCSSVLYLSSKYLLNINTMAVTGNRVQSVFDIVNVLQQQMWIC